MRTRELVSWGVLVAASLGVHAGVFAGLHGEPAAPRPLAKKATFVEMTTTPRPEPPAPAEPAKPAAPAPRRAIRIAKAAPVTAAPPTAAPPTEPEAEAPADFTGTTLTAGAGPGWASATGNGERMAGPIGAPGARVTGRVAGGAAAAGPRVVGVGDLSRAPEPPALDQALERHYPVEARRAGITGRAVVRARVMPDGSVRELSVASESGPGFGRACQATLAGSRWTAPIDREGRSVSTYIQYTCRFEVR